jgi:type 1 fimbriae regulatory protein FimB/type 1 fimbriae regulatory protein FimE
MGQVIELPSARREPPTAENTKVHRPRRRPNKEMRSREHLTPSEVARLLDGAAKGRYGQRDRTLLLITYRHGLRVGEVVSMRWDQVDLKAGHLHVARLKNGVPSTHPLRGPELRALRQLRRDYPEGPYLFVSQRGGPMTTNNVREIVLRAGRAAGFTFRCHPHQIRHSTGFALANAGHDTRSLGHFLGHRNLNNTMRYTELAADRFKDFWKD